jgi:peptidyl-prolyl cis-trans isomerase D
MRKNLKSLSWTLWLVILTFVGFIFVEWGAGRLDTFGGESDLLSINGDIIKGDEFTKKLVKVLENYKMQLKENFNVAIIKQLQIPEQILQDLVVKTIINQEAAKLNIQTSDQELSTKIVNLPGLQRDGKFIGTEEYQRVLAYQRINISEFEDELKKDIVVEKFKDLVSSGLVLDNLTLWQIYQKEKDTADIDYIILKPERIKQKIEPSETELKTFYEKNKNNFKSPEKRAGEVLFYKFDDFKKEIEISNQELYDYFKENKKTFVTPEKTKVSRLYLKYSEENRDDILKKADNLNTLLNSKNFAQKARELSQDDKASAGGDWGYWEWKNFSSQELDIIKKSNESQISTPIDTREGFSILYISEKIPQKQEDFESVKTRIKDILERDQINELVKGKLEKIQKKLHPEKSLKDQSGELGFTVEDTGFIANGNPLKGIDEMGYVSRNLFSLKQGEIGSPIELRQGMAIVRLSTIKEPGIEAFSDIREQVLQAVTADHKMNLLLKDAGQVLAKLKINSDEKAISSFLKKNDLSAESITYKRGNKLSHLPIKKGLDEIIFSLNENQYALPVQFDSQIALIKLKTKKIFDMNEFEKERATFYQTQIEKSKNDYFGTYIMNKRQNAEIKFNQELFGEIKDYVMSRY